MKYCKDSVYATTAKIQYNVYSNDESLDFQFTICEQQLDKFFCKVANMPEYDQFGLLAITLMCMSPDTVECECRFSSMNLTKETFSTKLTQENLQARQSVWTTGIWSHFHGSH